MSEHPAEARVDDPLDLASLAEALHGTPFAGRVQHFAEIGSTNTHAMQLGADGSEHGTVLVADAQTMGRGRGAHRWSSPPASGLYVSVLLRPEISPGDALWLSLAAGLASQRAIDQVAGFAPDLRWPNDLLRGSRKLGGILTEMQAEVTRVRFIVVGIGINVHQREFPPELRTTATSLSIEAPSLLHARQSLLIALLQNLHKEFFGLTTDAPREAQHSLLVRLEAGSSWIRGKRVTIGEDGAVRGTTEGLDARGFLRVRTDAGELRTVLSGGVRERVD